MNQEERMISVIKLNLKLLWEGQIYVAAADDAKRADERNKQVICKKFAPFTECISEINNNQIYNAKDIYVVMPVYNLIECRKKSSKSSGSLW